MVKGTKMGMSDLDITEKEMELMKSFAIMECKMDIMKIMFDNDTAQDKVDAIAKYILGDKDDS